LCFWSSWKALIRSFFCMNLVSFVRTSMTNLCQLFC
jgi:hypothetical protein